jgi:hypothetical protein
MVMVVLPEFPWEVAEMLAVPEVKPAVYLTRTWPFELVLSVIELIGLVVSGVSPKNPAPQVMLTGTPGTRLPLLSLTMTVMKVLLKVFEKTSFPSLSLKVFCLEACMELAAGITWTLESEPDPLELLPVEEVHP